MSPSRNSSIRLVVGLGNPGPEYQHTRHNVGFMVLDQLVQASIGPGFKRHRFGMVASYAPGVFFLKPLTFMNLSGDAVVPMMRFLKLEVDQMVVISDDLDLDLGRIRVRSRGSSGGHNGLKSIAAQLGTDEFARIRVGIGRPPDPRHAVIDWVLGRVPETDRLLFESGLEQAGAAVTVTLTSGLSTAMNRFNAR